MSTFEAATDVCLFCVYVGWPGVHVQSDCWHWCPDHAQGLRSSWLGCQRVPHLIFGFYEVCFSSRLSFFNPSQFFASSRFLSQRGKYTKNKI